MGKACFVVASDEEEYWERMSCSWKLEKRMRQAASGDAEAGSDDSRDNLTARLFLVIKL